MVGHAHQDISGMIWEIEISSTNRDGNKTRIVLSTMAINLREER